MSEKSFHATRVVSKVVGKSLVVVGVGIDAANRYEHAKAVEASYERGEISSRARVIKYAVNVGGYVGGWSGAGVGTKAGAA